MARIPYFQVLNGAPSLWTSLELSRQASCWLRVGHFPRCLELGVLAMEGDGVKYVASGEGVLLSHASGKQKKASHAPKV